MAYEVQVKTILDKTRYLHLLDTLPSTFGPPSLMTIHQTRYRSGPWQAGDVRLRKIFNGIDVEEAAGQIIVKEDKPGEGVAANQRIEHQVIISLDDLVNIKKELDCAGIYRDPSWRKVKHDFLLLFEGHNYRVSVQYCSGVIVEQGYVAEGTVKLDEPDAAGRHKNKLLEVFTRIGLEPTPSHKFMEMVKAFVNDNSRYATGIPRTHNEFETQVKEIFSRYQSLTPLNSLPLLQNQ